MTSISVPTMLWRYPNQVSTAARVPRRVHEGARPRTRPTRAPLLSTRPWLAGRRQSHIQRVVGDRASGHHEALRLGDLEFGGVDQHAASIWQDVFVRPLPSPLACARAYAPPVLCGSIAIFCACLSLAFGLEVVVFSPARRASRKLLERIVEFIRLAGGDKRICEYNQARRTPPAKCLAPSDAAERAQEACRLNAFDGRKSLIRSFPSKVGVRAVAILEPMRLAGA